VEQTYLEKNDGGVERLRALVGRLGDDELARELEGGWTVAAALAHVAFWDRYVVARWELAQRLGLRIPANIDGAAAGLINDASLEIWRALPPKAAAQQALDAAEYAARFIAGLGADSAEAAMSAGNPRLVDRTPHWIEHIEQIERALA
jgi:hypothetical protein